MAGAGPGRGDRVVHGGATRTSPASAGTSYGTRRACFICIAGDAGGLVRGHRTGKGEYRLPLRAAPLFERRRRRPAQALVASGWSARQRPQASRLLQENHQNEAYLLAAVNAQQASPIIIATGNPVIALGGFTGRDPILTIDGLARLVEDRRVRFALVGDGSPGLRRIFGEDNQKALVDWIKVNGRPVDPVRWRTAMPGSADGRRAAEATGTQLYDLRPGEDGR